MRLLNVAALAPTPVAGSVVAVGLQSVRKDRVSPVVEPALLVAWIRKKYVVQPVRPRIDRGRLTASVRSPPLNGPIVVFRRSRRFRSCT